MLHYIDVIMTTMASQITSLTVVYPNVYSDADQRKHQSSASLAFVWGIHRDRWIPRTKDQLRGKCFHLMTSSWCVVFGSNYYVVIQFVSDLPVHQIKLCPIIIDFCPVMAFLNADYLKCLIQLSKSFHLVAQRYCTFLLPYRVLHLFFPIESACLVS